MHTPPRRTHALTPGACMPHNDMMRLTLLLPAQQALHHCRACMVTCTSCMLAACARLKQKHPVLCQRGARSQAEIPGMPRKMLSRPYPIRRCMVPPFMTSTGTCSEKGERICIALVSAAGGRAREELLHDVHERKALGDLHVADARIDVHKVLVEQCLANSLDVCRQRAARAQVHALLAHFRARHMGRLGTTETP